MPIRAKISLIILVAAAVFLRYRGFFFNTFHPDEALFAYWSRLIAVGRDPLLVNQVVDKPPLLFYQSQLLAFFCIFLSAFFIIKNGTYDNFHIQNCHTLAAQGL